MTVSENPEKLAVETERAGFRGAPEEAEMAEAAPCLFANISLRPLSPNSPGNGRMGASIRIYFVTFVQNLESPIQRTRKIGVKNFWEEELADGRHAILLYGNSAL